MTDIVERLNSIANLKVGDPFPEVLRENYSNWNWGTGISHLAQDAIAEIMRLRTTNQALQEVIGSLGVSDKILADNLAELRKR